MAIATDWLTPVFHHLWQSTLVLAAAWALNHMLRRHAARVRYGVWFAASIKFLLPFSLLIAAGSALRAHPALPVQAAAISNTFDSATTPLTSVQETTAAIASGSFTNKPHIPVMLPRLLAIVWIAGASAVALPWLLTWLRLARTVSAANPCGSFGNLPLRTSTSLMEPGVFGLLRQVLVLPQGIRQRLTEQQMNAILLHELQHARRHDNLTAALHMLVQIIFWFHPGVWWIQARLLDERERACDEAVLAANSNPRTYAEGILAICRFYVETPLACSAGVTGADLQQRIALILDGASTHRLRLPHKLAIIAVGLIALAIPLGVGLTHVHAASVIVTAEEQAAAMAAQHLEFDVASVKFNGNSVTQNNPPLTNVDLDPGDIFLPTGGIFSVRNKSLRTLIAFAYKMSGDQQNFLKLNVPDFVLTERFDIEARTTNRQATKDDYRAMVRSLLADRFALKVHNETRESKLYALVLNTPGKLGPNIRIHPADDATCATTTTDTAGLRLKFKTYNGEGYPPLCGSVVNTQWQRQGTDTKYVMGIAGRNIPMATLAAAIVNAGDTGLEHAVVDKTGITSNVDFTLKLGYDEMESTFTPNTGPYLLQNLRDQLGMKLRTGKGDINVYVVDHVEHLHEN